ncbi:YqcC family protein [Shewanella sp. SR44-3]|uniref:YqcC family protein n=1 Tax=unclassified Shewanella TaxID=196818 RepID=UPI0015F9E2D9|nr:YqcC family protein [Shewanella sp. SR44-3]MBB1270668.1 YqcC family protein [Shewanella sp. SR44-3]
MPYKSCKIHLANLEALLKQQYLWANSTPSAAALASTAPFACDTLAFEQWLQFIFIPKFSALINAQQALPTHMQIAPMAAQVWQADASRQPIIDQLIAMDDFINAGY